MRRRGLVVRLVAAVALAALTGCGKKGDPEPPLEEKVRYPRKYPK